MYGERCISSRVGQIFLEKSIKNEAITINGDGTFSRDFTYIDNVVQMNVDIQVEGMGDSMLSQKAQSKSAYTSGYAVPPKITEDPAKELMLLFITPDGYEKRDLVNEYGEEVDYRDYVAWTKDDKLYIITPHDSFHPAPQDISRSPDGQSLLFEYDLVPLVTMHQGNKTIMLYVK